MGDGYGPRERETNTRAISAGMEHYECEAEPAQFANRARQYFKKMVRDLYSERDAGTEPAAAIIAAAVTKPTAAIIDGKAMALQIQGEVASEVAKMRDSVGKVPGLAVILVGTLRESKTYVRNKKAACKEVGSHFFGVELPHNVTEDEVLSYVKRFNDDPAVHGVLVQLPLPKDPSTKKEHLVGDVCYTEACQVASKITPVPGGVGPMTIAMLMSHMLNSAKCAYGLVNSPM